MAADPERRYASMEELQEDLDGFLAGRPPRHARLHWARALPLHVRSQLRRPVVGISAAVAMLALAVTLWLSRPESVGLMIDHEIVVSRQDPAIRVLEDGGFLHRDEAFGVRVKGNGGVLYAFSIFGDGPGNDQLSARLATPRLMSDLGPGAKRSRYTKGSKGLRVPAGTHAIACAQLKTTEAGFEGFAVLLRPGRSSPWKTRWLSWTIFRVCPTRPS